MLTIKYKRTMAYKGYNRPNVPRDPTNEEFVLSFTLDEVESGSAGSFFEEFGFVVIRDVLSKEEIEASVDDVWSYLESGAWRNTMFSNKSNPVANKFWSEDNRKGPDRNIPHQWDACWPNMENEGILGAPPVFTKQAFLNRQNPNVIKVFTKLLNTNKLIVNIDRYGLFRPTINVDLFGDGTVFKNKPMWETDPNLHLDVNPWEYYAEVAEPPKSIDYARAFPSKLSHLPTFCEEHNATGHSSAPGNQIRLQALLNFIDNREQDGGFQLVPGFHKHLEQWAHRTRDTLGKYKRFGSFNVLPSSDPIHQYAERITMPAGSLLVWDIRLPHGSKPNHSDRPRMAQFLKYFPAPPKGTFKQRKEIVEAKLEQSGIGDDLTATGRKLFGLEDYDD
ncbi:htxA [Acrasis kona]|uniref:HtxA n=1 Tax=Acrasis kona TaxID=1008807 RepID=A0AAW2YIJ4_9EUKA